MILYRVTTELCILPLLVASVISNTSNWYGRLIEYTPYATEGRPDAGLYHIGHHYCM